ncbi:MAG: DUF4344 domain-containing metallopeptidase [Pikeienuella sp.]
MTQAFPRSRWLGGAVAVAALCAGPAPAQQNTELSEFVIGNAYHILLHEIGHLLIDQLTLPVLGQEEDAADNFATLTLIDWDSDDADQALADTAFGWLVRHDENRSFVEGDFFAEHDLDAQRAYRIVCHLVGTDADTYADLALNLGVEVGEAELDKCDYAFALSAESWRRVLQPYSPALGEKNVTTVRYEEGDGELGFFADMLRDARVLEELEAFLNETVRLPSPVTLDSRACGEANAYYDPETRSVTMCYELMDEIATIYEIGTGLQ